MNENAKKWIEALRSGEFAQAQNRLQTPKGYCCLGVLCVIYQEVTGEGAWSETVGDDPSSGMAFTANERSATCYPPPAVEDWAGFANGKGSLIRLGKLNDEQDMTFAQIADELEINSQAYFADDNG